MVSPLLRLTVFLLTELALWQSFSPSFGSVWSSKLNERPKACILQDNSTSVVHVLIAGNFTTSKQLGILYIVKADFQDEYHMALGRKEDMNRQGEMKGSVSMHNTPTNVSEIIQDYRLPPLVGALKASAAENAASFHFPGHNRGQAAPSSFSELIGKQPYLHDLNGVPELDHLFTPEGPILEAQKQAAELFGASETWFLVGGSTCGIHAVIMATCSPGDNVILPRNCHISAISGMILSGVHPKYILPDYDADWDIAGGITPSQATIEELEMKGQRAGAVLIVSPTYHGICSKVAEISKLCHSHGIPLIVDEAHGAHFGFHELLPDSALCQGADLVVQSTHKVLCSLTQSSMLHRSGDLVDRDRICRCLQMLQSSSPSYLLLASLDAARAQVSENKDIIFHNAIELAMEARSRMSKIHNVSVLDIASFPHFPDMDPLRVTIGTKQLGLSGFEADDILSKDFGVVSELVGTRSITLAFNLGTQREHILRFISGLKHLSAISAASNCTKYSENPDHVMPFDGFSMRLSPREAFFAQKTKVGIKDSIGQICGELICPYPPGIPVLIPGEVISEGALAYMLQVRDKGVVINGASDHLLSSLLVCNV
ncbi:unnamed protein product [Coffea canephora]|uniref:DH200=94 genomic scaffold, scaffold_67 n=1 Tax=Coffea canephora TaxID=49390 RepID=A0A068UW42_COFCA|nr:unnamed protein product [Coffea canephora]